MKIKIAASILSADFARLGEQVQEAIEAGVDYIHVDVMDGHFVPNLTIGPLVVAALRPFAQAHGVPMDVHLMIEKPERLIPDFAQAGANILTVHVEVCPHMERTIQMIKQMGVKAGVSLNPASPLVMLEEILPEVDLVLLMSVNPGFGGQSYIPSSTDKIRRLRQMLEKRELKQVELEVDGGIHLENAAEIVKAGATVLVCGTAIFNSKASIKENVEALKSSISNVYPSNKAIYL